MLSGESAEAATAKGNLLRNALNNKGPTGYWEVVLSFSQAEDNPPEAYSGSYGRAIIFSRLGERAKAIAELEKSYEQHQVGLIEIGVEPAFEMLRANAQFTDLVRRIGLPR